MRVCVQADAQHSQLVHSFIKHMCPPLGQLHAAVSCPCKGSCFGTEHANNSLCPCDSHQTGQIHASYKILCEVEMP